MRKKLRLTPKPVLEPPAQVIPFPSDPESVKKLMMGETLLIDELNRSETYNERVEVRKELREIREKLHEAIKLSN